MFVDFSDDWLITDMITSPFFLLRRFNRSTSMYGLEVLALMYSLTGSDEAGAR